VRCTRWSGDAAARPRRRRGVELGEVHPKFCRPRRLHESSGSFARSRHAALLHRSHRPPAVPVDVIPRARNVDKHGGVSIDTRDLCSRRCRRTRAGEQARRNLRRMFNDKMLVSTLAQRGSTSTSIGGGKSGARTGSPCRERPVDGGRPMGARAALMSSRTSPMGALRRRRGHAAASPDHRTHRPHAHFRRERARVNGCRGCACVAGLASHRVGRATARASKRIPTF